MSLKSSLIVINANLNEPMRDDHPSFNFDAISTHQLLVLLLMKKNESVMRGKALEDPPKDQC
jgi:hypothetical protein